MTVGAFKVLYHLKEVPKLNPLISVLHPDDLWILVGDYISNGTDRKELVPALLLLVAMFIFYTSYPDPDDEATLDTLDYLLFYDVDYLDALD